MRYTALEIRFWSVKCTIVRCTKISIISISSLQVMQAITVGKLDEKKPLQNALKRN